MRIESELVSVRTHRGVAWAGRLALLALWIAGIAIFGGAFDLDGTTVGCWTPLGLLAGTSVLLALRHGAFAGAGRRLSPGTLAIEDGVIEVRVRGLRRTLAVADVVSGWTESEGHQGVEAVVLLLRDGTEVRVACFHHEVAERVLRQAGVAPDQRAVRIRVRPGLSAARRAVSIFVTFVAGILAVLCGIVSLAALVTGSMLFFAVFGAFTAAFGVAVRRHAPALYTTTLSVGTDGVLVERFLRRRLLRRGEIVNVVSGVEALVFHLDDGEMVRVPSTLEAGLAVANRIEETFRAPPTPGASLDRLDRGERPIAAWIAELRGLSGGARGYREAALARDELLDLVKDGAAPVERRVAAAVALSAHGDAETRVALRVAADTCVDERLRVVLGRADEMADEELAEAIAEATAAR